MEVIKMEIDYSWLERRVLVLMAIRLIRVAIKNRGKGEVIDIHA